MSGWYVKRDEQRYGPYTSTQMVEMARKGQVLPLDWVSRGEGGQWLPASQVKGLFPVQATTAPPPLPVADEQPVKAEDRPVRPRRAAHPNRTPVILACAGTGCLVLIVAVAALFLTGTRDSAKGREAGSGGSNRKAGGQVKGGARRQGAGGKIVEELIARKGEPTESHTFPKYPQLEAFVWKTGGDSYDYVLVNYAGNFKNEKPGLPRRQVEVELSVWRK